MIARKRNHYYTLGLERFKLHIQLSIDPDLLRAR